MKIEDMIKSGAFTTDGWLDLIHSYLDMPLDELCAAFEEVEVDLVKLTSALVDKNTVKVTPPYRLVTDEGLAELTGELIMATFTVGYVLGRDDGD